VLANGHMTHGLIPMFYV